MTQERTSRTRPDYRERILGGFLRLLNPLARRLIRAGMPTGAPNILLTVRGRKSGEPRSVPIGIVRFGGHRYVQATYGQSGWAANLRAAGKATITDGDRREAVRAVELPPREAGAVLRRALEPFHRSRLLGALLGPRFRPPIGVLWQLRVRVDDTLEEYTADARRHPVFELDTSGGSQASADR